MRNVSKQVVFKGCRMAGLNELANRFHFSQVCSVIDHKRHQNVARTKG